MPKENNNSYAISQLLCQETKSWKVEASAAKSPRKTKQKHEKGKQEATRKNEFFFNLEGENGIQTARELPARGRDGDSGDGATGTGGIVHSLRSRRARLCPTFQAHPHGQALLEATIRAAFALSLVDLAVLALGAGVVFVVLHRPLEKALRWRATAMRRAPAPASRHPGPESLASQHPIPFPLFRRRLPPPPSSDRGSRRGCAPVPSPSANPPLTKTGEE